MKKFTLRKTCSVLLALFIAISASTGCTKQNDNNTSSSGNNAGSSSQVKTHKIKVMGPESPNPHIKFADRDRYLAFKELDKLLKEKNLDVQFEIIAQDQYEVTIQTRMASGKDIPDFCNITPLDIATCLNLANKGVLLPVNKIIEEHGDGTAKNFFDTIADFGRKVSTSPDGNRYFIPSVQMTTYQNKPASTCVMVAVRKDWLDKLKLPTPTNAKEFVDTLKAFRDKDANGNGVKDEIYANSSTEFASGISSWFGLPNIRISVDLKTNKIITPWYMDGAKEYFAFMNNLIKEDLLDETLIGAKGSVVDQMVAENKVGALYTYAMQTWYEPSIVGVKDAVYMPIGPLPAIDNIYSG